MVLVLMALVWLVVGLVVLAALLGLSLAVGATVHWLAPSIDLGTASLLGAIGVVAASQFVRRVMTLVIEEKLALEEAAEEDDEMEHLDRDLGHRIALIDLPRRRKTRRRK